MPQFPASLPPPAAGAPTWRPRSLDRLPSLVSSPADAAKALAIAQYYLLGEGGGSGAVLLAAFDFDAAEVLSQINSTREDLLQVGSRP